MTSEFMKKVLNYAKIHPVDPTSAFILENYLDAERTKKKEAEKWRLGTALEHWNEREG